MRAANSAVEVQTDGESSKDFHARVENRLLQIQRSGQRLSAAGYACAVEGEHRRASRRLLCRRLLATLETSDTAELVLAGGSWETIGEEAKERAQLIEIWSELSQAGLGPMMSVRFEDPPSESGVFRAAERLQDKKPINESVAPPPLMSTASVRR